LAYFIKENDVINFQKYIEKNLVFIKNNTSYFGKQIVLDVNDKKLSEVDYLLLTSLNVSIEDLILEIHNCHGKAVLAHALKKKNSIISQLGFIPKKLAYDAIEVKNTLELKYLTDNLLITNKKINFFISSDAHQLIDINERINYKSQDFIKDFFGCETI